MASDDESFRDGSRKKKRERLKQKDGERERAREIERGVEMCKSCVVPRLRLCDVNGI